MSRILSFFDSETSGKQSLTIVFQIISTILLQLSVLPHVSCQCVTSGSGKHHRLILIRPGDSSSCCRSLTSGHSLLSDKSVLSVTHFIAFTEMLTGIGSSVFFSKSLPWGRAEMWGAGDWLGCRGLRRDSQGWHHPHGSNSLLTLFQNNEHFMICQVGLF